MTRLLFLAVIVPMTAALLFLALLLRRDRREWLPTPEEWPDEWLGW